jgi:hypothetical protein
VGWRRWCQDALLAELQGVVGVAVSAERRRSAKPALLRALVAGDRTFSRTLSQVRLRASSRTQHLV